MRSSTRCGRVLRLYPLAGESSRVVTADSAGRCVWIMSKRIGRICGPRVFEMRCRWRPDLKVAPRFVEVRCAQVSPRCVVTTGCCLPVPLPGCRGRRGVCVRSWNDVWGLESSVDVWNRLGWSIFRTRFERLGRRVLSSRRVCVLVHDTKRDEE